MALYKGNKKYTVSTNYTDKVAPLTITKDGVYSAPTGFNGFNPITARNDMPLVVSGTHTDSDGIWHRPEEWDDIESIDLTNKHEVYFLCACHLTGTDFFRIRFYGGGTLKWSYGHVSNGVYTIHENSTETTVSSGSYIALYLANIPDDYIVVRITATNYITSCGYYDWVATEDLNYAMPYKCQSVLMRYGRMIRGTSLARSATYCLESDNILDFASYYWNTTTTITVAEAYSTSTSLQRWRCTGWDLAKNKITSFYCMFYRCKCLTDVPRVLDLSGWVTSNTTRIDGMFQECYSLNTRIIANNWDLTNVTNMGNMFYQCYSIKRIDGTGTWNAAPKCTTIASIFYGCISLMSSIDLSNLYLGNGTADLTSVAAAFQDCYSVPSINLSNTNFSKCTTIASVFQNTRSCKQIILNNITPITNVCTSTNSLFQISSVKEIIIDGWNFSGCTTNFLQSVIYNNPTIQKLVFKDCTAPSNVSINDSSACCNTRNAFNIKYLDVSFLDMSVFTNTTTHAQSFRDLISLVEFYPPKNISKSFNLTNDSCLSHDSLLRVINNLVTLSSGTTATLTLGTTNIGKLSAAEQAIATNKGWTLA